MKIDNRHERLVAAGPERVAELVSDLDGIWPTTIAPAPRSLGEGRYRAGPMVWEELDLPGAIRAFRVVSPARLHAKHWFEAEPVDRCTLVRHVVDGEALGESERVWRDRIAPLHDRVLEALLDRIEAVAVAAVEEPGA